MRYFLITLAAFMLLAAPAFAADVDVEVNIDKIIQWDAPTTYDKWVINIEAPGDYGTKEWNSPDSVKIESNVNWKVSGAMTGWVADNTLDTNNWVMKGQWDGKGWVDLDNDLYNDGPGTYSAKLKLQLSGMALVDGYGQATTTVTFTLAEN